MYKHGHAKHAQYSKEYGAWCGMKRRCYSLSDVAYANYGGRGIRVCLRWKNSFAAFLEDMGERPTGYSLDRIDNKKGYSKANCRWAPWIEQNRNKRTTKLSMEKARAIRADTRHPKFIALDYQTSIENIRRIKAGRTWKEL